MYRVKFVVNMIIIVSLMMTSFSLGVLYTQIKSDNKNQNAYQSKEDIPKLPEHSQEKYIVYKEGYRDNRIELVLFDGCSALMYDGDMINHEGKWLGAFQGKIFNDTKYYLNGNQWIEFESNYGIISENATDIIVCNVNIYNSNGILYNSLLRRGNR